ncbi:MAG: nickel-dependent hydrogenase large subunit [Thermodesulfovibrionales bacterium]
MKLRLPYISRVEGEAAVKIDVRGGEVVELKLNIWEPPRFFEGFLAGRKFDEVPDIVARICGICPVSHMTTAIRALEKALGVKPPAETVRMREIMALSQTAASHVVHLYMLALPDYHGLASIAGMLPRFEKEIRRLVRMKEALNGVTAAFGGRALHPVAMVVSGFTRPPSRETVGRLIKELDAIRADALETLKMVAALPVPEFENRDAEYAALTGGGHYALNMGRITSSRGLAAGEDAYSECFVEEQVPYANAKRTTVRGRGSLMVGALSRLNLKFDALHEEARQAARSVGFQPPSDNPFHNNLAQAVETVHAIARCVELMDGLTGERPWAEVTAAEGEGTAVTEAPRGLLMHYYRLDRRGTVEKANIVTPTAHNFLGLEENLRKLVREHMGEPKEAVALKCEMLIRAYDPCFSCSVH